VTFLPVVTTSPQPCAGFQHFSVSAAIRWQAVVLRASLQLPCPRRRRRSLRAHIRYRSTLSLTLVRRGRSLFLTLVVIARTAARMVAVGSNPRFRRASACAAWSLPSICPRWVDPRQSGWWARPPPPGTDATPYHRIRPQRPQLGRRFNQSFAIFAMMVVPIVHTRTNYSST
jgi:hypothetical protein